MTSKDLIQAIRNRKKSQSEKRNNPAYCIGYNKALDDIVELLKQKEIHIINQQDNQVLVEVSGKHYTKSKLNEHINNSIKYNALRISLLEIKKQLKV